MSSGDTEVRTGGSDPMTLKMSKASAKHYRHLTSELGSVLTGRRTFETADGWGGNHGWGPAFVLTHRVPAGWPRPNSTVHFVTDGIESAVKQAKAAAGGKSVGVHGANTIRQLLNAGLLDEIHVDIAALLLGSGVRLFDHLDRTPAGLGNPTVIAGAGVTHLRYAVPRSGRLHREAVYRQLHRMQHEVIAMEDYVARDDRPAGQCLVDVARKRAGSFDPLATYQLLQATTPYVPITDEQGHLLKVIDRIGVATKIARTVVERQLGRR